MEEKRHDAGSARPAPEELKELLDDQPSSGSGATRSGGGETASDSRGLEFLYDVPLQVSVEVGRSKILLRDLLKMGEGYV
ncbi:MAG: FliM/FliN family flagellar motor switch protein, partial [Desulfofustis sp.]|nr:FliM/FliN family flagellar motor switch protein [Desulfofustis sp.]